MSLLRRTTDLADLLLGSTRRVRRWEYLLTGVVLLAVKFVGDSWILRRGAGRTLTLEAFLDPVWSLGGTPLDRLPSNVGWALVCWTVAFLWIAVSMSVRRSVSAGFSPAWGLLVLAPVLKVPTVLALCIARDDDLATASPSRDPARRLQLELERERLARPGTVDAAKGRTLLIASLLGLLAGAVAIAASVIFAKLYGLALFLLAPVVAGFVIGFTLNRDETLRLGKTVGIASWVVALGLIFMLAAGAEGALCLLMASPIVLVLAAIGALVGRSAALCGGRPRDAGIALALLPLLTGLEARWPAASPPIEVRSEILIHATPEAIWPHVVSFPELPPADDWLFRESIADPRRATIAGEGVGAVRRCEFSTGPFIEPITAWEPPTRLAFDVTAQPRPMRELSPWGEIDAPHLDGYLRAQRGEFRLEPVDATTTRLVGSTWYELDIQPLAYWRLWSDAFIHAIHMKVLRHIAAQVEPH
ncbi:MAG TPA: SRPBCC family protein [Planctomycetota bacterium]|nr:SRPBCC family protein [Planctomycetota bacterium]